MAPTHRFICYQCWTSFYRFPLLINLSLSCIFKFRGQCPDFICDIHMLESVTCKLLHVACSCLSVFRWIIKWLILIKRRCFKDLVQRTDKLHCISTCFGKYDIIAIMKKLSFRWVIKFQQVFPKFTNSSGDQVMIKIWYTTPRCYQIFRFVEKNSM